MILHDRVLRASFTRCRRVRVTSDLGPGPIKAKIADVKSAKVHTMLVIGGRDVEAGDVSVCLHGKGNVGLSESGRDCRYFGGNKKEGR